MTEHPSDILALAAAPNLQDRLFCTKIKFFRFPLGLKNQAKQSNFDDSQKQSSKSLQVSPLAARLAK